MQISNRAKDDFLKHACDEYPKEAVGVIINDTYFPCTNIHTDPLNHFMLSGTERLMLSINNGSIQAILHSHPVTTSTKWPAFWPSGSDMESWLEEKIPFGICSTDGVNCSQIVWLDDGEIAPLEGRTFIHGIHDCYSLIRDWYRINRNIVLPNYARCMDWWEKGLNLYDDNFEQAGFIPTSPDKVKTGDVVLMKVRAQVTNHAAVVIGPNKIMHHLYNRLSGTDSLHNWMKFSKYVTYVGDH